MKGRRNSLAPRIVHAPAPIVPPGASCPLNHLKSVLLDYDEELDWIWSTEPDGTSYVSGFRTRKKREAAQMPFP